MYTQETTYAGQMVGQKCSWSGGTQAQTDSKFLIIFVASSKFQVAFTKNLPNGPYSMKLSYRVPYSKDLKKLNDKYKKDLPASEGEAVKNWAKNSFINLIAGFLKGAVNQPTAALLGAFKELLDQTLIKALKETKAIPDIPHSEAISDEKKNEVLDNAHDLGKGKTPKKTDKPDATYNTLAGFDVEVTTDGKSPQSVTFALVTLEYIAYAPLQGVQGSIGDESSAELSWTES